MSFYVLGGGHKPQGAVFHLPMPYPWKKDGYKDLVAAVRVIGDRNERTEMICKFNPVTGMVMVLPSWQAGNHAKYLELEVCLYSLKALSLVAPGSGRSSYWIKGFDGHDENTGHVHVLWHRGFVRVDEVEQEILHSWRV